MSVRWQAGERAARTKGERTFRRQANPPTRTAAYPAPAAAEALERRALFASVVGSVFLDLNVDGARQSGEPGLAGWQVALSREGTDLRRIVTTGATGRYEAANLPAGTYRVAELVKPGYAPTAPAGGATQVSVGVDGRAEASFGNRRTESPSPTPSPTPPPPGARTARITGIVFNDVDGDGVRDAGEPGLAGWRVFLDANNNGTREDGERQVASSATGAYLFAALPAGAYRVREVVQPGYELTRPTGGAYDVTLAVGQAAGDRHFGNHKVAAPAPEPTPTPTPAPVPTPTPVTATVRGMVFNDANGNGARDAGEAGLANWVVYLDNGNGKLDDGERQTKTGPDGRYVFEQVVPGPYQVRQVRPSDEWAQTKPQPLGYYPVTLVAGQQLGDQHFGNRHVEAPSPSPTPTPSPAPVPAPLPAPAGTISGVVFNDLNNNGTRDHDEPGLPNTRVFVDVDDSGEVSVGDKLVYTALDGRYSITGLSPGTYQLVHVANSAYFTVAPSMGTYVVTLSADRGQTGRNFADSNHIDGGLGTVTGVVFHDANGNGRRDAGETGIAGRTVFDDANGNGVADAGEVGGVTNNEGRYTLFNVPSGRSPLRQVVPDGWAATNGVEQELTLIPGYTLYRNFGSRPLAPTALRSSAPAAATTTTTMTTTTTKSSASLFSDDRILA